MREPGSRSLRIAGMLRVKNEARWIRAVISSIQPLCDPIVVLDDHSEDATPEICRSFGGQVTVLESPFRGIDESRDKNFLLARVMKSDPQWCLCIDGDEIMESSGPGAIRGELAAARRSSYALRVLFLWNAPDTVRVDGVYGRFFRPSLFRAVAGAAFSATCYGGHFHCGNVPGQRVTENGRMNVRLYHLGYMCPEDRLRKYTWYNTVDPGNESEDRYRHMVQGDVPDVPPHLRLRHAGPLTLVRLPGREPQEKDIYMPT